jgi:ribosomal RNA-processing protein 8
MAFVSKKLIKANARKTNKKTKHDKKKLDERIKKGEGKETRLNTSKDAKITNFAETDASSSGWSKSKKKRMRALKSKKDVLAIKESDPSVEKSQKKKKKQEGNDGIKKPSITYMTTTTASKNSSQQEQKSIGAQPQPPSTVASKSTNTSTTTSLQQSFRDRLAGSRFRILNEELYTTHSTDAFAKFSENPQLYHDYHDGFRHQVATEWPVNPVDVICKKLAKYVNNNKNANNSGSVIADFGCGDAALAKQLKSLASSSLCTIHSFDLVASCDLVTACDMARVPLKAQTVDVAVFCLSLMGTNLADFIREAHRVLKASGKMHIAEVKSRFESKDDNTLQEFVGVLDALGFCCVKTDQSNKMFVLLECEKNGKAPDKKLEYTAKPCIYKRR